MEGGFPSRTQTGGRGAHQAGLLLVIAPAHTGYAQAGVVPGRRRCCNQALAQCAGTVDAAAWLGIEAPPSALWQLVDDAGNRNDSGCSPGRRGGFNRGPEQQAGIHLRLVSQGGHSFREHHAFGAAAEIFELGARAMPIRPCAVVRGRSFSHHSATTSPGLSACSSRRPAIGVSSRIGPEEACFERDGREIVEAHQLLLQFQLLFFSFGG